MDKRETPFFPVDPLSTTVGHETHRTSLEIVYPNCKIKTNDKEKMNTQKKITIIMISYKRGKFYLNFSIFYLIQV